MIRNPRFDSATQRMSAFAANTAATAIDCQLRGSRTTDVAYVMLTKNVSEAQAPQERLMIEASLSVVVK
jgi:hypothetical protein